MIKFMRGDSFREAEAATEAVRCVRRGYIRQAANLLAWLAALMAFWLMGKHGGYWP
jgi:hypothetical protein